MGKDEAKAPAAPKLEKNKDAQELPKQSDMKPGVPDQEPPTAGPTARVDGDPNKPGEKL